MKKWLFLIGLVLTPAAAQAEWRAAESAHFIVVADGSEEKVRAAAVKLEKYDFLLRFVSGVTRKGSPIKVKVFMVEDMGRVQSTLYGAAGSGILGYYDTGDRGPIAVMPRGRDAEPVLFHEYAHHFMRQFFPAAYPTWYSEGFAEYYGQSRIKDDDLIEVGQPAQDRYQTFAEVPWVPVDKLLTAHSYADVPGDQIYSLYAEGWLLIHYLSATTEGSKKLSAYIAAINAGKSYKDAVKLAFGDTRELDNALRAYSRQRRVSVLQLHFKPIDTGEIKMRMLSGAEIALMPQEIKLSRSLLAREAEDFVDEVRSIARKFPDDPYALSIQAEAEHAAGNDAAAASLIDKWLTLRPNDPEAVMWKSKLEMAALVAAKKTDEAAWAPIRARLLAANRADPNDPFILETYYDSYAAVQAEPPAHAQNALFRAFELLPQSDEIRYKVARDFEQRGLIEDAIETIKPAAFGLSDSEVEDAKKKAKLEKEAEKYKSAERARHETPREMLARLEEKLNASAKPAS